MTTKAEQAAALRAERAAEAERIKAAEADGWRDAHEAASYDEAHADLELVSAQGAAIPLRSLELIAARQAVFGAEARVNAAAEARRSADWNLRRLGHWDDPPEPDEVTRCAFDGCRSFKALDDDGRCPHHPLEPTPPPARSDGLCANLCGRRRKQRGRYCLYCKTGQTVPVCAIERCGGPAHDNGRCRRHARANEKACKHATFEVCPPC